MKLAVQTLLLPGQDMHARFAAAAVAGYDGVEVATGPSFDLLANEGEIGVASAAAGVAVAAICTIPWSRTALSGRGGSRRCGRCWPVPIASGRQASSACRSGHRPG